MRATILILFTLLFSVTESYSQADAKHLIRTLNQQFAKVHDYSADVLMQFNLPGVKMNDMQGKVFYKKPDKFRIKAKGIFFLPKQNPMQQIGAILQDTNSYTAVISGYEKIQNSECAVVNIIPLRQDVDLILGKFWIKTINPQVVKSQITSKQNGTVESESKYNDKISSHLPSSIFVTMEMNKIKMPKMMAADLNKKSSPKTSSGLQKEKGKIELHFSNYKINTKLSDAVFVDTENE